MDNKLINVVWCDDAIEKYNNKENELLFRYHNCFLFKTAKTANELKAHLIDYKDQIDAVIVDFNVSTTNKNPESGDASGFQWVHHHFEEYAPIPFYLYSARDEEFIRKIYKDFQFHTDNDYFLSKSHKSNVAFGRNRHFQANQLEDLLSMIEKEVAFICTPTYRIRQEYSEAFAAINKFGLNSDVFIKILLSDESIKLNEIITKANPMRMVIERLISLFESEGIIPKKYVDDLNNVPGLFSGKFEESHKYSSQDWMPKPLSSAFKLFLKCTQDGSHDKNYLSFAFREYLTSTKDLYLVKALAIICLDIIKWASPFYDKYQQFQLFLLKPFKAKVSELRTVNGEDGGIVNKDNKTYFIVQPNISDYRYKIGTNVEITSIKPTNPEFGDYYCYGKNLDVEQH